MSVHPETKSVPPAKTQDELKREEAYVFAFRLLLFASCIVIVVASVVDIFVLQLQNGGGH